MKVLSYDEIKNLVQLNNKSRFVSDEFVICLIWKESGFRELIKNKHSSATGLMQITKAAIQDVNRTYHTAFVHAQMTDPAKNIQCGTHYLDLRIKWARDITKGIEGYGTGRGYADSIYRCESCLSKDKTHWQFALHKIHK